MKLERAQQTVQINERDFANFSKALQNTSTSNPQTISTMGTCGQTFHFPLMLNVSFAWGLQMVMHSEGSNWFRSLYFETWVVGSCIAVIYMPRVTIFTRHDPLVSEAYRFLDESLGSLSLTLWSTLILLLNVSYFPQDFDDSCCLPFSFYPILILGVDGVRPHHHINESVFWTDFLVILSGFGIAVSLGIILVILSRRSIEGEVAPRDASKERKRSRSFGRTTSVTEKTPLPKTCRCHNFRPAEMRRLRLQRVAHTFSHLPR
ncbi:uncharacterized protein LACBIDRAFT_296195 [Laccaria bicolor S238N-H82]|uniref:Predicted protein n=1 Tax=Laccaria bicolor (strain S238N-H82 / ATCC MYA-4686) TaxID=486041 RepID=B0D871_LACBS|nr:uncharacterized protein LACBIDRAFT_296195 [Laccaria bicolor S238N-H82]EDR08784.1 predicted protein [Laccaria bicolor S238N-H82]|eukprot:XP_001880097.1 predicted protein [Laccaria bicolor S238N-H82]